MFNITGTTGTLAPVVGTLDNKAPVENLFIGIHHAWEQGELFRGDYGENRFVPKKGDNVMDKDTGALWVITKVDSSTKLSTLRVVYDAPSVNLTGNLQHTLNSELYRLYLDKSTPNKPFPAVINNRLTVAGSGLSHAIVYRGTGNWDNRQSVSKMVDAAGNVLTDRIPLEQVSDPTNTFKMLWNTVPFRITEDFDDGEVLTAVYFTADGHVSEKRELLVELTGFIHRAFGALKTVQSIELYGPSIKISAPSVILKSKDETLGSLGLKARIHYADGSVKENIPLSDPSIDVIGVEQANFQGRRSYVDIILKYTLAADEGATHTYSSSLEAGDGSFVTRRYKVKIGHVPAEERGLLTTSEINFEGVDEIVSWFIIGDGTEAFDVSSTVTGKAGLSDETVTSTLAVDIKGVTSTTKNILVKEDLIIKKSKDLKEKALAAANSKVVYHVSHPKHVASSDSYKTLDRKAMFRVMGDTKKLLIINSSIPAAPKGVETAYVADTMFHNTISLKDVRCASPSLTPTHIRLSAFYYTGAMVKANRKESEKRVAIADLDKQISFTKSILPSGKKMAPLKLQYEADVVDNGKAVTKILAITYVYAVAHTESL